MFNQYAFDIKAGTREDWFPGPGCTFQDPCTCEVADGWGSDGYLIAILNRPLELRSELVILDTQVDRRTRRTRQASGAHAFGYSFHLDRWRGAAV
jgi:hypothetical protein